MNKRIFTMEQLKDLQSNKNVAKCSEKQLSFTQEFKLKAVRLRVEERLPVKDIFRQAGFDLNVIGLFTPKDCLKRWGQIYKTKGRIGFEPKPIGRPKTRDDKIKRLEAQVAYLKAENDFLAKLRAKRAE
jgi:transposase-like protein